MSTVDASREAEYEESKGEGMTQCNRIVPTPAPTQPDFPSPTVSMNESDALLTHPDHGSPRPRTPGQEPHTGPDHEGCDVAPSHPGSSGARRMPAHSGDSGHEGTAEASAVSGPLIGGGLNLKAAAAAETSTFSAAAPDTGRPTSNIVPEASRAPCAADLPRSDGLALEVRDNDHPE